MIMKSFISHSKSSSRALFVIPKRTVVFSNRQSTFVGINQSFAGAGADNTSFIINEAVLCRQLKTRTFTTSSASSSSIFESYPYEIYVHEEVKPKAVVSEASSIKQVRLVDDQTTLPLGHYEALTLKNIDSFQVNPKFEDFLHDFISKNLLKDEQLKALAQHQKSGWLHIHDHRVFTPYGRVPDPEDILGSVLVNQGNIVESSYQRMPTHRILSTNGLFQLSSALQPLYIQALKNKTAL